MRSHPIFTSLQRYSFSILLLLLLSGCIDTESFRNPLLQALLAGEKDDCQLLCWYGLTPGKTTPYELQSDPFFADPSNPGKCMPYQTDPDKVDFSQLCSWQFPDIDVHVIFEFGWDSTRSLREITLMKSFNSSMPDLYFNDLVDELGEPEAAWAFRGEELDTTCSRSTLDDESSVGRYGVIYPSLGIIAETDIVSPNHWPCLYPNMVIDMISIRAPQGDVNLTDWFYIYREPWDTNYERLGEFPGWKHEIIDN
jgi:hypothetical protein